MERALRERRERADLFDVVAEELRSKWLAPGAREDVDEAPANRDLASLFDALHALVPCSASSSTSVSRSRGPARVSRIASVRTADGGMPSARARAETQTRPPSRRTSRARARSPTRCAGIRAPTLRGRRLGRSATAAGSTNQPTASAASRASSSSASTQTRVRSRVACNAVSSSGSAGSETRVRREGIDERGEPVARGELTDESCEWCRRQVHAAGGNDVPPGDRSARSCADSRPSVARDVRAAGVSNRGSGALCRACRTRKGDGPRVTNTPRGTPVSLLVTVPTMELQV